LRPTQTIFVGATGHRRSLSVHNVLLPSGVDAATQGGSVRWKASPPWRRA
jgi:hypothetical protein